MARRDSRDSDTHGDDEPKATPYNERPTPNAERGRLASFAVWTFWVAIVGVLAGCGPGEREAVSIDPPKVMLNALDPALSNAVALARAAVERMPMSGDAWGRLGQAFEAAEYFAEAQFSYREAIRRDAHSPRWLHLLGLLEMAEAPEAGLAHLARAVERAGATNDAPGLRLAQALIERGRWAEAVPVLERLLTADPEHAAARLELARVRLGEGQEEAAAELLVPCLTNVYTARSAAILLSQVRAREGRSEEAAELGRRAATLPRTSDWPDVFVREVQVLRTDRARWTDRVGTLLAQRRFAEAEGILSNLLARLPDDPEVVLLAGRALLQQRRCAEAEARFRAHLRSAPTSLNGLIQLGIALLCQERWADAAEVLERAIVAKPDFAQAHANLGLARSRLGDTDAAIRCYREALRCSPGDAGNHAALAEELARAGQREEALRHAARALELDPSQPRASALRERLTRHPSVER